MTTLENQSIHFTLKAFVCALIFSILSVVQSSAQNWQPIVAGQTYNYYSTNGNVEVPFIHMFTEELSEDSLYGEFLLGRSALEDCSGFSQCNDDTLCGELIAPFLQSKLIMAPDGTVIFQNPDTFQLRTQASLEEEWQFSMDSSGTPVFASVTALMDTVVLGANDSLKVIETENDRVFHLSKNHGIIGHSYLGDTLSLHAINNPLNNLPVTAIFDFQIGDKFCYHDEYYRYSYNVDQDSESSTKYESIRIMEVSGFSTLNDSIFMQFERSIYTKETSVFVDWDGWVNDTTISLDFNTDTVSKAIDIAVLNKYFNLPAGAAIGVNRFYNLLSDYWYEPQNFMHFFHESDGEHQSQLTGSIDTMFVGQRKAQSHGFQDFQFVLDVDTPDDQLLLSQFTDAVSFDVFNNCLQQEYAYSPGVLFRERDYYDPEFYFPLQNFHKFIAFAEGLGSLATLRARGGIESYGYHKSFMIGYEKGDETAGYIPEPGVLQALGINERQGLGLLKIYPNPTKGFITVELPDKNQKINQLSFFDLTGRQVKQLNNVNRNQQIDISTFSPGIYLVEGSTENGRFTGKVMVE